MGSQEGPKFQPYVRMSDFVTQIAFRQKTITVTGKVRGSSRETSNIKIPVRMTFDSKTLTKMEFKNLEASQDKAGGDVKVQTFRRRR